MAASSTSSRSLRQVRRGLAALLLVALAAPAGGPPAVAAPADAHPPGPTGDPIVLYDGTYLRAHDVLVDADGTTYLAWSTTEALVYQVHSCTIPAGGASCTGGIRTVSSPGDARGLELQPVSGGGAQVLVMYDTDQSGQVPMGAELAHAFLSPDGTLNALEAWADAPSFGHLLHTSLVADELVAVVAPEAGVSAVYVYDGPATRTRVKTPYPVADADVAEPSGGGTGVLAVSEYGSIDEPIAATPWTGGNGTTMSPDFTKLRGTWDATGFGLATTGRGVELVASDNSASYETLVTRWNGSTFGKLRHTGIGRSSCSPTSHDLETDGSGRLVDTYFSACGVGVANLPQGVAAGVTTFRAGATPHSTPQVDTGPRGTGWVTWATEGSGVGFDKLRAVPIVLPAAVVTTSRSAQFGRASLAAPQTCLPPVDAKVRFTAAARHGWTLRGTTLTLDGSATSSPLRGASLAAGSKHALVGTARFTKHGNARTLKISATFKACPA